MVRGYHLTPGGVSVVFAFPAPLLGPAATTSRSELPPAAFPATRRPFPLPLPLLEACCPAFSFVLDASDLESSTGAGLDLAGGILLCELFNCG